MQQILQQLMDNEDCITVLVKDTWFEGIVSQVTNEFILLYSEPGNHGAYYSSAIRIKDISVIQFTTDFRPTKEGQLVNQEESY